jgi:glucose-6-phosphate-specific signal transduction histidine kinase
VFAKQHPGERAQAELRSVNERLHSLSRQLLDVQEREGRWITRELHDEIGQMQDSAAQVELWQSRWRNIRFD